MIFLEEGFTTIFTEEQRENIAMVLIASLGIESQSDLSDLIYRICKYGFIQTLDNDKDVQRWFYLESVIISAFMSDVTFIEKIAA